MDKHSLSTESVDDQSFTVMSLKEPKFKIHVETSISQVEVSHQVVHFLRGLSINAVLPFFIGIVFGFRVAT